MHASREPRRRSKGWWWNRGGKDQWWQCGNKDHNMMCKWKRVCQVKRRGREDARGGIKAGAGNLVAFGYVVAKAT